MAWPELSQRWRRCVILVGVALGLAGVLAGGLLASPPSVPPSPAMAQPAPDPILPQHPPSAEMLGEDPYPMPPELVGVDLNKQSAGEVDAKSSNCLQCHEQAKDPHYKSTVHIGCTDCHGANDMGLKGCTFPPRVPGQRGCPAAPPSRNPEAWISSANPVRSYTLLNHESPDFIRFVNPGDLRINHISCGTTNCHPKIVQQDRKSMMTHGCMLWGAALYNNGSIPNKVPRYGEFYSMTGVPLRAQTYPPPTEEELEHRGVIPFLEPLPRFEITQPGNILRIFERGGSSRPETGIPDKKEPPGNPSGTKLSNRGLGTQNRTDPVFIGLQKTRLFDPTLNFMGTNDQPGDYRSSGCSACHFIYANDRSPVHSGPYARFGNLGKATADVVDDVHPDPMIPKDESGHPIQHRFAKGNSIPTSQCMVCHVHPGTTVMNSYIGWMWYDQETDGELMYPAKQRKLTAEEYVKIQMANPEETAVRGNWSNFGFLSNLIDLNPLMKKQQVADFHGHGWVFRAVFKHDRRGRLLDYNDKVLPEPTAADLKRGIDLVHDLQKNHLDDEKNPFHHMTVQQQKEAEAKQRAGIPMHLVDIHVEKGMHCVDCHFVQDEHGNNRLQMEVRAGVEIQCIDCHGSATMGATLRTGGPASYTSSPDGKGRDLTALRTPKGKARFERRGDKIFQNSLVEENLSWEVVQTKDTIDPASDHYNPKSAIAKTVHFESAKSNKIVWGKVPETPAKDDSVCAHSNKKMTCQACHSSWNPTCYGCHLPQKANYKMPQLHNEGDVTRNYTAYNWQTLRDDVFMLAKDGNATRNRTNCARSSCAVHVGSYNNNRESIYVQQQTISGEGFSGIAFSTNVPHTVSGKGTTKQCTDCHCSKDNDNNAIMAQLLMQGTNYLNFMGRYCWVAAKEHGLFAVVVTEQPEPQAVIGSSLHKLAYPEEFEEFEHNGRQLEHAHEHPGVDIGDKLLFHPWRKVEVLSAQARGEYLYAACGEGGLRVFDIAFIDDKGFSERFSTAPVSQLGQQFYVNTKYATYACAPATTAPDPTRRHYVENHEGSVAGIYGSIFVCDKYEGVILVGAGTLLDGDPLNNFLKRDLTFNPKGLLCGARYITFVRKPTATSSATPAWSSSTSPTPPSRRSSGSSARSGCTAPPTYSCSSAMPTSRTRKA